MEYSEELTRAQGISQYIFFPFIIRLKPFNLKVIIFADEIEDVLKLIVPSVCLSVLFPPLPMCLRVTVFPYLVSVYKCHTLIVSLSISDRLSPCTFHLSTSTSVLSISHYSLLSVCSI